jgi:hypothetical protein
MTKIERIADYAPGCRAAAVRHNSYSRAASLASSQANGTVMPNTPRLRRTVMIKA